jgi:hypothetical protein
LTLTDAEIVFRIIGIVCFGIGALAIVSIVAIYIKTWNDQRQYEKRRLAYEADTIRRQCAEVDEAWEQSMMQRVAPPEPPRRALPNGAREPIID